jgi:hypothetical protein
MSTASRTGAVPVSSHHAGRRTIPQAVEPRQAGPEKQESGAQAGQDRGAEPTFWRRTGRAVGQWSYGGAWVGGSIDVEGRAQPAHLTAGPRWSSFVSPANAATKRWADGKAQAVTSMPRQAMLCRVFSPARIRNLLRQPYAPAIAAISDPAVLQTPNLKPSWPLGVRVALVWLLSALSPPPLPVDPPILK